MVKKVIRLSESDIHQIIRESINQILNEVGDTEDGQKKLGALARRKMDDGSLEDLEISNYAKKQRKHMKNKKKMEDAYYKGFLGF